MNTLICASVGLLGAALWARGRKPLLRLQRAVILARACGYLCAEMLAGARSRLYRFDECVERARREV